MANGEKPLLLFPRPAPADRLRRRGGGDRPSVPPHAQQAARLAPRFQRLQQAFEAERVRLQEAALGVDPEKVLVLETAGSIDELFRAAHRVGLEWLLEAETSFEPGEGFAHATRPERAVPGRVFLVFSDQRALQELQRLFELWEVDPTRRFDHGLNKWRDVFNQLKDIRPWNAEDRLRETGLTDDWRERIERGDETVRFEAELWYRGAEARRDQAERTVDALIAAAGGQTLTRCAIPEIGYHALLGEIPIEAADRLIRHRDVELLHCDDLQFLRPVGQCAVRAGDPEDTALLDALPADTPPAVGEPVIALLDGMPLDGHALLEDRLRVDDPDD